MILLSLVSLLKAQISPVHHPKAVSLAVAAEASLPHSFDSPPSRSGSAPSLLLFVFAARGLPHALLGLHLRLKWFDPQTLLLPSSHFIVHAS